ncbi:hypothetical protein [Sphingomonas sp. TZW2008]|uniref:hypothetical protein n=1 Tax=Sphingomonas sp. TZW2008 TaxID=1917973 RepID=UPI000A27238B|nr:hypothetical protein [Sphingomonas sp. TZW2008]
MVFDLRSALLRRAEVETARLVDFAFRGRTRTTRLLAERIGRDPAETVSRNARADVAAILADPAREIGGSSAACAG